MLQFFTIPCVLILEITNHLNLVFLYTLFLYLLHCTTLILTLSFFSWNIFIFSFLCDELMLQIFASCFLCVAQLPFLNFYIIISLLVRLIYPNPMNLFSIFLPFFMMLHFTTCHYIIPYNLMELSTQRINIAIYGVNMYILFSPYAWNM